MQDYTTESYKHLLTFLINSGYALITVEQYITGQDAIGTQPVAILRHDIDRRLQKALVFADIESNLGISATYYFRYHALSSPEIIRFVSSHGHEIGYHYEVMSSAAGDPILAKRLFEQNLIKFREIDTIHTVCMHGAPLSGFDNLSFWDHYRLDEFDLLGEAFLSVSCVEYFSDTGRTWSPKHKIRDRLPGDLKKNLTTDVTSTDGLIRYLTQYQPDRVYILTHPERWAESRLEWIFLYGVDLIVNLGKSMISIFRGLSP